MSDRDVWRRVLDGDARAFGVLWDRHHDRVFRHLLMLGMDRADADELTGTAFLQLWRRRRTARFVHDSVLPWLLVTARNVSRNAARARRRYRAVLDALPPPGVAPDPSEVVEARLDPRIRSARRVMDAARPADRELVALTAIEGLTVIEAAQALGMSESAARMRLSRLRARLEAQVAPPDEAQLTALEVEGSAP